MYKRLVAESRKKEDIDKIKQWVDVRSLEGRIETIFSSDASCGLLRKIYLYEVLYHIDDRERDDITRLVFSLDSRYNKIECTEVRELLYSFDTGTVNDIKLLESMKSQIEDSARKNRVNFNVELYDTWLYGESHPYHLALKGHVRGDPRKVINFQRWMNTKELKWRINLIKTELEFK